ncbi:DNA-binding protein [Actinomadura logoneensis]|uniref:DNA-binding protein n=1 Tax=Actinomadura logoneensis TaxID=2293572 RepID=A0A372JIA9_9ACTN|nr:DNA-binding protein [Actinomadura logoneensis]
MPQQEAADRLGIGIARVGLLIANGHLEPVKVPVGGPFVTTASVEAERAWRDNARRPAKLGRVLKDIVRWF